MKYGFLKDNKWQTVDKILKLDDGRIIANPTDEIKEQYCQKLIENIPTLSENQNFRQIGYNQVSDKIIEVIYEVYEIEHQPRIFSKYKLIQILMKMNLWAQTKSFIEASGYEDLWIAATNLKEDDSFFIMILNGLKTQLNLNDEQVEMILSNCIYEF